MESNNILEIRNLKVHFALDSGVLKAVDGVDLDLRPGEVLGIIGESGCGKSVTSQAIMGIVGDPGKIAGGNIHFKEKTGEIVDIAALGKDSREIRSIRGRAISMIFQEPMTSLSPVHTIGSQIDETIRLHRTRDRAEARQLTLSMLRKVGISNAEQRYREYPHQLSGGLRQRVMIAMALSCEPSILIADEPTTALDVTVQAQILDLLKSVLEDTSMGVIYITHDLGVISEIADEIAVMYLGRVVEKASKRELFKNPLHPYTQRLLRSVPRLDYEGDRLEVIPGTVPIPIGMGACCGFHDRCEDYDESRCVEGVPELVEVESGHFVRCYRYARATGEKL